MSGLFCCVVYTDSIPWKLFYVTGCLFVAMQNMEDWEEAVFDKAKNRIELKTFSLYAVVLTLWRKGQEKGLVVQKVWLLAVLKCEMLNLFSFVQFISPSCLGSHTAVWRLRPGGESSLLGEGLCFDASSGSRFLLPSHSKCHSGRPQVGLCNRHMHGQPCLLEINVSLVTYQSIKMCYIKKSVIIVIIFIVLGQDHLLGMIIFSLLSFLNEILNHFFCNH